MTIRKCTLNDAPILFRELGCNREMMRYTGWNPYSTQESTMEFLERAIGSDEEYSCVIEQDGEVVGTIGAYDFDNANASIEIGYSVFQEHWGNGYATGAVALMCDILQENEHIERITAWSADENTASAIVLERNGFEKTGIIESAENVDGHTFSRIIWEKKIK